MWCNLRSIFLSLVIFHRQKYKAGVYLLVTGFFSIPAQTPSKIDWIDIYNSFVINYFLSEISADMNCLVGKQEPVPIYVFAFRTHAHSLGRVISGYKYTPGVSL